MRKVLYSILCLILLLSINGCSGSSSDDGVVSSNQQKSEDVTELAANDIAGITVKKNVSHDITLSATAPAGSTLTYLLDSGPQHGTVVGQPGALWTYTPATGYVGGDSFTYHVNDGTNNSNPATVYLTVVNADPADPNGTSTISATGGQGFSNNGGNGGGLWVYSYRHLSLTLQGIINTTFDVPVVDEADLGNNPAVISSHTVIYVLDSEPDYGTPYMIAGDPHLYISNEDGYLGNYDAFEIAQERATGLFVQQGVIVEVEANLAGVVPVYENEKLAELYNGDQEWLCSLTFTNNIIVYGTLKTKPVPEEIPYGSNSKGSLGLSTSGQVLVAPSGVIDLAGDKGSPFPLEGGNGGNLWIQAAGTIALKGVLDTSGGEGTQWGGAAGLIDVYAAGVNAGIGDEKARIYNLGQIKAQGGNGEGGGNGGAVYLHNNGDDIYCAGDIFTLGGASVRGDAGNGGLLLIEVGMEGDTGNLIMSGNLNSSGGDSADRGSGGMGGYIMLSAISGNMTLTGTIKANGGAANGLQCNGGQAGTIIINAVGSVSRSSSDSTGLIQVGSIIEANGGQGKYNGAPGGGIYIGTKPGGNTAAWSHDVQLIGYRTIDLNGGEGSYDGGCGGQIMLLLFKYDDFASYDLLNEVVILATGGMGASGYGGNGGVCMMNNETNAGAATNSGAIDIADGDGAYGVNEDSEQVFYLYAYGPVANNGTIMATGGAAVLDRIHDSLGGVIYIESWYGDVTNTAEVRGTGGARGGNAGGFLLFGQGHAANSGSLYFDGGSGGGDGGWVEMDSGARNTDNTAALITVAGSPNGKILKDYKEITTDDGTLP